MDETEDDATRYSPNSYGVNHQQDYDTSSQQKLTVRNAPHSRRAVNRYVDEDDEELGEQEEENDDQSNGFCDLQQDLDDDDDDEVGMEESEDEDDDDKQKSYGMMTEDADLKRLPKKRKLKSLVSSYEFAPRVPAPSAAATAPLPLAPKPLVVGRNSLTDWTERETFVLLDVLVDRFLQHGRKSLQSEEWLEVAEKVSDISKTERTDTQCKNRLDTLKKKFKKEKTRMAETGDVTSKWVYFKKMDMMLSSPPQQAILSCGLDSGDYIFGNPRAYLNHANKLEEMRDSPGSSESSDGEKDVSDGLPPKKRRIGRVNDRPSFNLLADSIIKFSEIYEKIENSKRQQMVELEKMRMDFHREIEMQKTQILERVQAEIAKIQQGDEEENDVSAENPSG